MTDIKYPRINVPLIGEDGNAFAILGVVTRELRRAGVSIEERAKFNKEAMSGDYDHMLQTVMAWVSTDEENEGAAEWYTCEDCMGSGGRIGQGCGCDNGRLPANDAAYQIQILKATSNSEAAYRQAERDCDDGEAR